MPEERHIPGKALQGPDRARRVGIWLGRTQDQVREGVGPTPHPPTPAGVGPFPAVTGAHQVLSASRVGRDPVLPPGTPTPYTHPGTIPVPVHLPTHVRHAGTDCSYTRFRDTVGEPRGARTHPVSGSQAGLTSILRFTRPYDWVQL